MQSRMTCWQRRRHVARGSDTTLYNACLKIEDVHGECLRAAIVIIFNTGNDKDLKNYRPISALVVLWVIPW